MQEKRSFFVLLCCIGSAAAFELPKLFGFSAKPPAANPSPQKPDISAKKEELLQAVSFTNNGKTATPEQQIRVLDLVQTLETTQPAGPNLLTEQADRLDGTWYLQYTSPSQVGDADQFPDAWKPSQAESPKIETRQFNAQGSVSAAGIKVETANRVVRQIFDVENQRVTNLILLDDDGEKKIRVEGYFRQSDVVPNRAVVGFDTAKIDLGSSIPTLNLGFLFAILAMVRGTSDNGWLETTYIDDDMRIGRGNKGTMFVLTRDIGAVQP